MNGETLAAAGGCRWLPVVGMINTISYIINGVLCILDKKNLEEPHRTKIAENTTSTLQIL